LVRDVELHTGAAYVIMERKSGLYRRILLGMVSGESRERRGNILRKVPVALWRIICKCFVKNSLETKVGVYFTVLFRALASSRTRFLDHKQRRATVGMTPLNE
jgi:hypothetical protein